MSNSPANEICEFISYVILENIYENDIATGYVSSPTNLEWIPPDNLDDGACRASECHWMIPSNLLL